MGQSISPLPRPTRRRLARVVHKTRESDRARRALAILQLAEGLSVTEVARRLCAARSTVYLWWGRFEAEGERGLEPNRGERPAARRAPARAPQRLRLPARPLDLTDAGPGESQASSVP